MDITILTFNYSFLNILVFLYVKTQTHTHTDTHTPLCSMLIILSPGFTLNVIINTTIYVMIIVKVKKIISLFYERGIEAPVI